MKLNQSDKDSIRAQHKAGTSISQLARDWGVSRQYIQFIVYPERQKRNYELRKKRRQSNGK